MLGPQLAIIVAETLDGADTPDIWSAGPGVPVFFVRILTQSLSKSRSYPSPATVDIVLLFCSPGLLVQQPYLEPWPVRGKA